MQQPPQPCLVVLLVLQPSAVACYFVACHFLRNWASFNCFSRDGTAVFNAGQLGGSTQEFVITVQLVFGDVELGHGRQAPWGPQAVAITQSGEGQQAAA